VNSSSSRNGSDADASRGETSGDDGADAEAQVEPGVGPGEHPFAVGQELDRLVAERRKRGERAEDAELEADPIALLKTPVL
jgi:hypothetical protein